jgi:putative peptidoglycan lipid II flippase
MKRSLQLGILASTNIGINFLSQSYILVKLGPGIETDALFAGLTIPQIFLAIVNGSLVSVLVPLLAGKNKKDMNSLSWNFIIIIIFLFIILNSLLYVTAQFWIPISVPGFSLEAKSLTIALTRIQLIGTLFIAINGIQYAFYSANKKFAIFDLIQLISSLLGLIALFFLIPIYGSYAAAWIFTLRSVFQVLLAFPSMGKPELNNSMYPSIKIGWQNLKPLLFGSIYYKTDTFIDRFLLSSGNSGSLSLYYLSQQVYGIGNQVVGKTFSIPIVPILSEYNQTKNQALFRLTYLTTLKKVLFSSIIFFVLVIFARKYLSSVLIIHANFSTNSLNDFFLIMLFLSGMFLGNNLGQVSSSSFYALGNTLLPTRIGMYTYTIYVPIKILMFNYYGLLGLAFSTSLFVMTNYFLQNYFIQAKINKI